MGETAETIYRRIGCIMIINFKKFLEERNEAIIEAVMEDKWDKVHAYWKKYGIPQPPSEELLKASVYKAAHEIKSLPLEVRETADKKCTELGFKAGVSNGI